MGIMNGTTNFMLTKMEQEGADYAVVLKEAQDLGFAEADPTADVEGHDVQAKIALLAKVLHNKSSARYCLHSTCYHCAHACL
jgi:homoserine dehydrogenase